MFTVILNYFFNRCPFALKPYKNFRQGDTVEIKGWFNSDKFKLLIFYLYKLNKPDLFRIILLICIEISVIKNTFPFFHQDLCDSKKKLNIYKSMFGKLLIQLETFEIPLNPPYRRGTLIPIPPFFKGG